MNRPQLPKTLSRMISLLAIVPQLQAMTPSIHTPYRRKVTQSVPVNQSAQDLNDKLLTQTTWGNVDEVKKLISLRADVNCQTVVGYTPLMLASERGNGSMMRELLALKADVNHKSLGGSTALMRATDDEAMYLLLDAHASIDAQNCYGYTALHLAMMRDNTVAVRILVKNGANPDIKDNNGRTAWDTGNRHMVNILTDAVCARRRLDEQRVIRMPQEDSSASSLSPEKQAQLSLSLMDTETESWYAAIERVRACGTCSTCLEDKKSSTAKILTPKEQTQLNMALMRAIRHGQGQNVQEVKSLISQKAQVSFQYTTGESPLMFACMVGDNDEIVDLLLTHKANVQAQNQTGQTALMHAALKRRFSTVKKLLDAAADVQTFDEDGNTALHVAVHREDRAVVSELILHDANAFAPNKKKKTAFDNASDDLKKIIAYTLHRKVSAPQKKQPATLRSAL